MTNLLDFQRHAWVTYFLSFPAYPPISYLVIAFDVILVVGALLAIFTRKLMFWKVGIVYYAVNAMVSLIVLGKLLVGPKSGQMGLFEFQFNLIVYGCMFLFAFWLLYYFYSKKSYFSKK